jgi:hypothetical protein
MDVQSMVNNIRAFYAISTEVQRAGGVAWYANARREAEVISAATGVMLEKVVAVIAALSPQNKWDRNIIDAANYCHAYANGLNQPKAATFRANQDKAWRILTSDDWRGILRGRKVTTFYANIIGYGRGVTVDIWAIRAATNFAVMGKPSKRLYDDAEVAYQIVADSLGLQPCVLQAIVWETIRQGGRIVAL